MTVTVAPTVDAANTPPRVLLSVTANGGETATTITRHDPDGTTVPVRTPDGNPLPLPGGTGQLYDYEPPYGQPVTYSTTESPATVSRQVTVPAAGVWLIHPGAPALSMPVELRAGSLPDETYGVQQGVFYPMGRERAVVVSTGARHDPASQLIVAADTPSELAGVKQLISDAGVLLLNIPPRLGFGFDTCYISVADVKISRLSDVGGSPERNITMPFVTVDRPSGGSQAQRAWTDVVAAYSTWAAVKAAYPTWTDLLTGP